MRRREPARNAVVAGAPAGFRLFISSTFRDFVAERDALHEQVFPWLARFCASHGMEFQVVDLRWGVSEAAGLEQTTVDICLREIARCKQTGNHPNFLFLLGDRYGWRPLPTSIPADEFDRILERLRSDDTADERAPPLLQHWYPLDRNAIPAVRRLRPRRGAMSSADRWAPVEAALRSLFDDAAAALDLPHDRRSALAASTTEQEINAGVFDDPSASQSVIGIFRSIQGLPADRQAGDFLDIDAIVQIRATRSPVRVLLRLSELAGGKTAARSEARALLTDSAWHELRVDREVGTPGATIQVEVGALALGADEAVYVDNVRVSTRP